MGKRSLLGGARRHQQVREQTESERAWRRREEATARTPESRVGHSSGSDSAGSEPSRSPAAAAADADDAASLQWTPEYAPARGAEPVADEAPAAEQKPIPWQIHDQGFAAGQRQRATRAEPARVEATALESTLDSGQVTSPELLNVTVRDVRNRRLIRLGWMLLVMALVLALVLAQL